MAVQRTYRLSAGSGNSVTGEDKTTTIMSLVYFRKTDHVSQAAEWPTMWSMYQNKHVYTVQCMQCNVVPHSVATPGFVASRGKD